MYRFPSVCKMDQTFRVGSLHVMRFLQLAVYEDGYTDQRSWVQGHIWDVYYYLLFVSTGKDANRGSTLYMLIPPSLPPVSSHSPLLYHISLTHSASLSFIRGVGRIRSVIDRLFLLQDACSCSHARALSTATDIDIRCVIVCVFAHFHLSSADLF